MNFTDDMMIWFGPLNLKVNVVTFEPTKKTQILSIEYWLFNRDPYNGLL